MLCIIRWFLKPQYCFPREYLKLILKNFACIYTFSSICLDLKKNIKTPSIFYQCHRNCKNFSVYRTCLYNTVRHKLYLLHPPWTPKNPVNSGHSLLCAMLQAINFTVVLFFNLLEKPHRLCFPVLQGSSYNPTSKQLVILFLRILSIADLSITWKDWVTNIRNMLVKYNKMRGLSKILG